MKNWEQNYDRITDIGISNMRKEIIKGFIQNLLNQKDKELKEFQQRSREAKILTAEESYKNGRIIMKAEIREVIRNACDKIFNVENGDAHYFAEEILKHIK